MHEIHNDIEYVHQRGATLLTKAAIPIPSPRKWFETPVHVVVNGQHHTANTASRLVHYTYGTRYRQETQHAALNYCRLSATVRRAGIDSKRTARADAAAHRRCIWMRARQHCSSCHWSALCSKSWCTAWATSQWPQKHYWWTLCSTIAPLVHALQNNSTTGARCSTCFYCAARRFLLRYKRPSFC